MRNWIRRRWKYLLVGVIAAIAIAALLLGVVGMRQADEKFARLQGENSQLWEENAQLQIEVAQLQTENARLWEEITRLPELSVDRGVKFLGAEEWTNHLGADTGQRLEFLVRISSNSTAHNVWVKAELPELLFYKNNLEVDGVAFFGDVTEGVNIGTVTSCASGNVTFEARLATASKFPVGETILVIPIKVWADCVELDSGEITIVVERSAPAPSGGGGGGSKIKPPIVITK